MKNKYWLILLLLIFLSGTTSAQKSTKPETSLKNLKTATIDDVLKISNVGWSAVISPDGKFIADDIGKPDFDRDVNLNEIWIADVTTGKSRQLSKADDDLYDFKWSPDGKWLTCISGKSNQIVSVPVAHSGNLTIVGEIPALNSLWFNHFLWGDPLPDFSNPVPVKVSP